MKEDMNRSPSPDNPFSSNYEFWASTQNKKNTTTYNNIIARQTSIMEAIFVQRFLYLWEKFKYVTQGEIFIVPDRFCSPIGMTLYAFREITKKWERLGIISTKCKHIPLKKYYKLNEKTLAKYLDKLCQQEEVVHLPDSAKISPRNREDNLSDSAKIYNPIKHLKINKSVGDFAPTRQSTPTLFSNGDMQQQSKETPSHKLAIRLHKALAKKRRISKPTNISNWTGEFTKLIRDLGKKELPRIKQVLKWYTYHIGQEFVPEAFCANSFAKKFIKIESAMKRDLIQKGEIEEDQDDEPEVIEYLLVTDKVTGKTRHATKQEQAESDTRYEKQHYGY